MSLRTHELHPSLVHAPLVLLPAAALVDLPAALSPRDARLDRAGYKLWWGTVAAGLLAGLAGMAASQEIQVSTDRARDRMFLHGIGNVALLLSAMGVAPWRSSHRASLTSAASGIVATGAASYMAYLGGELVYSEGAGVKGAGQRRLGGPAALLAPGAVPPRPRRGAGARLAPRPELARRHRAAARGPRRARAHRSGGHRGRGARRAVLILPGGAVAAPRHCIVGIGAA